MLVNHSHLLQYYDRGAFRYRQPYDAQKRRKDGELKSLGKRYLMQWIDTGLLWAEH